MEAQRTLLSLQLTATINVDADARTNLLAYTLKNWCARHRMEYKIVHLQINAKSIHTQPISTGLVLGVYRVGDKAKINRVMLWVSQSQQVGLLR